MPGLRKKKGSAYILTLFAFLTFLLLYTIFAIGITKYKLAAVGEILDNSLVVSNLSVFSTNNLDQDLLSQSPDKNIIIIKDPNKAIETWKKHMKYNFSLDDNYTPKYSTSFIKSKVDIKTFIIYNVDPTTNNITEYKYNAQAGSFDTENFPSQKGIMKTENGNTINVTTVDSNIGFTIDTIFNKTKYVTIGRDVGIYKKN
ncbi:hypothetical protein [Clostridium akagii]|uniref:hypothetical protein n=1 Tax=Clostridium akagii TaxID=91623 RepID=UPI00047D512D|nr:hypothetical protein [Clostridium akagii]